MSTSWGEMLRDLSREGDTFWAAPRESGGQMRLFGGLVLAHGLAAAAETTSAEFLPQSLHGYFIRGGQPGVPIQFDVARLRDGRAFCNRRVSASQDGKVILEMMASFHVAEGGGEDWHAKAPLRPSPEDARVIPRMPEMQGIFEMRGLGEATMFSGPPYWLRVNEPVADDPVSQACALTFLSDMGLMAAARPRSLSFTPRPDMSPDEQRPMMRNAASLDHAIWFHRPYAANEWHLYEATKLNGNDARGLVNGALYNTDGVLIASIAQEALWRVG